MSPYRARNGQKRENLWVWRIEDTDFCSFEVMSAISNITLAQLMGVHLARVKGAERTAEIRGKDTLGVLFCVTFRNFRFTIRFFLCPQYCLVSRHHDTGFKIITSSFSVISAGGPSVCDITWFVGGYRCMK